MPEEERILKKEGVKIVKKRYKEFLKPYGFEPYPHSTVRLVRVREHFIDEVFLDTVGYHLDPEYRIYARKAPFAPLRCDHGRLWRATKAHTSTHLQWKCKFITNTATAYYTTKDFEATWNDVVYVLKNAVLPQMDTMTEKLFLSRLQQGSPNDEDFFLAHDLVCLEDFYYQGMSETAVYGVELWGLGRYSDAIPYLTFAQQKYRQWLVGHEQDTSPFYLCHIRTLALLDQLLNLWERKGEDWMQQSQESIHQVAENWMMYLL